MTPRLETERLTLRGFRDSDLDDYAQIVADAEVVRYMGNGHVATRDEAWRQMAMMIGHWTLRGHGRWAVTRRGDGRAVGWLGFYSREGGPRFELGWMLARRVWGHGYATEGARAALAWAFSEPGRDTVISLIHPDNVASIRVAERIGAAYDGRVELRGSDVLVYRIDRGSWRAA